MIRLMLYFVLSNFLVDDAHAMMDEDQEEFEKENIFRQVTNYRYFKRNF